MEEKKIKEVCKIGQEHDCCRYLICGAQGFGCAKNNPFIKAILDKRVEEGTITARGDNCDG